MERISRTLSTVAVVALLALTSAVPASAQYFGQNKVQYDDFDWRVINTEHFDLHFYLGAEEASLEMARAAERWNARISALFEYELSEIKPIVMYANHPDFQQTNIIGGEIGLGTGGVTDAARNRATQPYTADFNSTMHVVGHELVHVFQYDLASRGPGVAGMSRLPLWVIEGMAEYVSVGRVDPHTAMWVRDAVLREDIPTVSDLSSGRYFPYRYGQALLAYIGGRWGDAAVVQLYRIGIERGVEAAIAEVTGLSSEELSEAWAEELRETYLPVLDGRQAPADVGRLV
ncbi:MAG TPA: basic secretory protein-like protein, partial [Longimicrobiaceae bacterium]|nr:basic secretory protein-like protein [Longimicrobiaceae bacterium]